MFDLIVRNATLPDGRTGVDIGMRRRQDRGDRARASPPKPAA